MPGPHLVDGDLAAQQRLADCDFQNKGKRFDERAGAVTTP
jgi:hypothetical protein